MYVVYMLQSIKDGRHYTGITNNITRRLAEHNRGKKNTPSTRYRGPFEIIYSEEVTDRKTARAREKYLKSGAGREFITKHIPR